jgi:hypothetical protein
MGEGFIDSFNAVVVGSGYSQFLVWEIEYFDYLTEADINTGSLMVTLVNEFPVNCNVVFEFIDSEGTYIDEYAFGGSNPRGLNPGRQELNFLRTGITLNPEIWDMLGGEVFGSTPVLTVYFSNPIGIPFFGEQFSTLWATTSPGLNPAVKPGFSAKLYFGKAVVDAQSTLRFFICTFEPCARARIAFATTGLV